MKICHRCKKEINLKKDRWVNLRDFDKGKNMGEKDVHIICWKKMIMNDISNALREKVKQVMSMIKQ